MEEQSYRRGVRQCAQRVSNEVSHIPTAENVDSSGGYRGGGGGGGGSGCIVWGGRGGTSRILSAGPPFCSCRHSPSPGRVANERVQSDFRNRGEDHGRAGAS